MTTTELHMRSSTPAVAGALLVGAGLGGFADGIVFHQILQWHNMLSNRVPPVDMSSMRLNMVADGWFHAAMWLATLTGVWLLQGAACDGRPVPARRRFLGLLLLGWGLFDLVEGVIDHQLLQLHFVRQVPDHLQYDLTFLTVLGLLPTLVGWWLARGHDAQGRPA